MTLWYQPSLGMPGREPFGVLVESHADSHREVFGILKRMESKETSIMGEILAKLPEILRERLAAAADRASGDRAILDELRRDLQWNIHADALAPIDSDLSLRQVAYGLFAERVDVDRADLTRLREDHIDQPTAAFVGTQYTIDLVA